MDQLIFRTIKLLDIGYIAAIYFVVAMGVLWIFDKLFGKYDKKKDESKSKFRIGAEIFGMIWLVGIVVYAVRNIIGDYIPSPFEGIGGFEHKRVKELTNAGVFTFIFMYYFKYLKEKMEALYDHMLSNQ